MMWLVLYWPYSLNLQKPATKIDMLIVRGVQSCEMYTYTMEPVERVFNWGTFRIVALVIVNSAVVNLEISHDF